MTLAREVLAALNAHDLDRYDRLLARDYRAEIPGNARPVDRKEDRARLESFFKAFRRESPSSSRG